MRILTVDDELVSSEKMKKIMFSFGKCQAVDSGNCALEIFKAALDQKEPLVQLFRINGVLTGDSLMWQTNMIG